MKIKIGHLIYIYTYIKYFVFRREMSKKFRISDNTKSNVSAWFHTKYTYFPIYHIISLFRMQIREELCAKSMGTLIIKLLYEF